MDCVHNEAIISIYPKKKNDVFDRWLFTILPYMTSFAKSEEAIKGQTLNNKSMSRVLIPVPPLAEQKRIVAKIEKLYALIDGLK